MADLCSQCSLAIIGEDYGDFAGITPVISFMMGEAALVLCEGCGPIQVDPMGQCISRDCIEKGHGNATQTTQNG